MFGLLVFFLSNVSSAIESVQLVATHRSYSEASAVIQMQQGTWNDRPKSNGEIVFTRNRLSFGGRDRWWSLHYIERHDAYFRFSPDTAELLFLAGSDRAIPADQVYHVDFRAQQLAAHGVRVGVHLPEWQRIQLTTHISLLNGRQFQEGRLFGTVAQTSPNTYQGQTTIDYRYDQDRLLEHELNAPIGRGVALDIHVHWRYKQMHWSVFADDVWMQMNWQDSGRTAGQLNTDNAILNDNGFVRYTPLFKGIRGIDDYQQSAMPTLWHVEVGYDLGRWQVVGGAWQYGPAAFPFVTMHYETESALEWSLGYEAKSQTWRMSLERTHGPWLWMLKLGTDHYDVRYAHSLDIQMSAGYAF